MKKKVMIIFGGRSTEYYVSCISAAYIIRNIDRDIFDVLTVGIDLNGNWVLTYAEDSEIEDGETWLKHINNKRILLNVQNKNCPMIVFDNGNIVELNVDCIFPIAHGQYGEDGCLQGFMETWGIPYVGCGVESSACSMNKQITRMFADAYGVKRPKSIDLKYEDYISNKFELDKDIKFPVFVKPANGGSSVGITKVNKKNELKDAILKAFSFENNILIEEGVIGRELSLAIMGNKELEFGELCEIVVTENQSFDYESKYITHTSSRRCPTKLKDDIRKKIENLAQTMYKALNCQNWARIDFFLDKDENIYFNEINTIPAMGEDCIFPIAFMKKGINSKNIISKLIMLALNKQSYYIDVDLVKKIK